MVKNNKGLALVTVMVYTLVLTVIGTAILAIAMNEYRMEKAYKSLVKAYYLAEAGMEKAIYMIAKMDVVIPESVKDMRWEMEDEDMDLVEPGVSADYEVTVREAELYDVIFTGQEEDSEVYKRILGIKLRSLAVYKGAPAGVEAGILVEDYEETGVESAVQVEYWRQIRGINDEN